MRASGRLCALCALLAFAPTSVAQSKITPLPKPAGIAAKPAAGHAGSLIAPLSRPAMRTTVRPARRHVASARRVTVRRTTRAPRRHAFVAASSRGGRERAWRVLSSGGRETSALAAAAAVVPTPLELVGAGDLLPVYSYAWPAWKIVLLTLMAVGEAFVLVRLARDRGFARTRGI
jgi:hypothetical protein